MLAILALLAVQRLSFAEFIESSNATRTFAVAAYLPEWRYSGVDWNLVCKGVSHLILFSLEMAPSGQITALDRLPSHSNLREARAAATRHGTQLLICFGGNGRSQGFAPVVSSQAARKRFLKELVALIQGHQLDGVDYNWEYPGYDFRTGYARDELVVREYDGLATLLEETREAFKSLTRARGAPLTISAAYYPDGRQERLFVQSGASEYADLLHMMAYDQTNGHHSSREFTTRALAQGAGLLPREKVMLGLPFYGRHARSGEWKTYEDIAQQWPGKQDDDSVTDTAGDTWYFNGPSTIAAKTEEAIRAGVGGIMIWEVGQDCRREPVHRDGQTHVRTCASNADALLPAITGAMARLGVASAHRKTQTPREDL
jgi:chitinase